MRTCDSPYCTTPRYEVSACSPVHDSAYVACSPRVTGSGFGVAVNDPSPSGVTSACVRSHVRGCVIEYMLATIRYVPAVGAMRLTCSSADAVADTNCS